MNKNLLHRFFEDNTNIEEEKQIRHWIETSEANRMAFLRERKIYDTTLFSSSNTSKTNRKGHFFIWYSIGTAVAMLILLIVSTLYVRPLLQDRNTSEYNTLVVPAGQRIHLILADNTDIWLNANTTLRYPTKFSRKDRTVYLDGEAFFDVSKDPKKPFMVKTAAGDIKVTGTSFNVEAYLKQGSFETSLFEGSVEIYKDEHKLITLKPDEKSYLKEGKLYVTSITDNEKYLWKDGLIAFNNKPLEDILASLEKYFDVRIKISHSSLPQRTYTGKFRQSDGVDYALRVLQRSILFSYERDEETGIINIKK